MSNTPETDAFAANMSEEFVDPAWLVFSQALERERDEARKEVEYYRERYEQLKEGGNERAPEIPKWYNGREIPADIKDTTK